MFFFLNRSASHAMERRKAGEALLVYAFSLVSWLACLQPLSLINYFGSPLASLLVSFHKFIPIILHYCSVIRCSLKSVKYSLEFVQSVEDKTE